MLLPAHFDDLRRLVRRIHLGNFGRANVLIDELFPKASEETIVASVLLSKAEVVTSLGRSAFKRLQPVIVHRWFDLFISEHVRTAAA